MDRLTKRLQEGKALCIEECEKECVEGYYECHKCKPFADVLKKLADYEDAEEQGLLFNIPCKAGSTIYIISRGVIIPLEIYEIGITENTISMHGKNEQHYGYSTIIVFADKKPIEWFYTIEEAKQKLKELQTKTDC